MHLLIKEFHHRILKNENLNLKTILSFLLPKLQMEYFRHTIVVIDEQHDCQVQV